MTKINLRDYYPAYRTDYIIDVTEELAATLYELKRSEAAYLRRVYRNKAYYSLDRDDGIENDSLYRAASPEELYERKMSREAFHAVITSLPDKQAKRIYEHFFLGWGMEDIAKKDGVSVDAVQRSMKRGLKNLKKWLSKLD